MQRMQAALTRTQPSQRSCKARLALAEWLHRRLRRGGMYANEVELGFHKSQLRRYRLLGALLRSTLQRQLHELTAATKAAVQPTAAPLVAVLSPQTSTTSRRVWVEVV